MVAYFCTCNRINETITNFKIKEENNIEVTFEIHNNYIWIIT